MAAVRRNAFYNLFVCLLLVVAGPGRGSAGTGTITVRLKDITQYPPVWREIKNKPTILETGTYTWKFEVKDSNPRYQWKRPDPWKLTEWKWADEKGSEGTGRRYEIDANPATFEQTNSYIEPSDPFIYTIKATAKRWVYEKIRVPDGDDGWRWKNLPPKEQVCTDKQKVLVLDQRSPKAMSIDVKPTTLFGTTGEKLSEYVNEKALGYGKNPEFITIVVRDDNPHCFSPEFNTSHPIPRHNREDNFKLVFHYTRFEGDNFTDEADAPYMTEQKLVFEKWKRDGTYTSNGIEVEDPYQTNGYECTFKIPLDALKLSVHDPVTGEPGDFPNCSLYFANSSELYDIADQNKQNIFWITVTDSSGHGAQEYKDEDDNTYHATRVPAPDSDEPNFIIKVVDNDRPNIYVRLEDERGNFKDWIKERWSELFQNDLKDDGTSQKDETGLWVPQFGFTKYRDWETSDDVPDFPRPAGYKPLKRYPTPFNCNFTWNGAYSEKLEVGNYGQIFVDLPEGNLIMRNVKVKFKIMIIDNIDGIVSDSEATEYYQMDEPKATNFVAATWDKITTFFKNAIENIAHKLSFSLTFQEATPENGFYEMFFHAWDKAKDFDGNPIDDYIKDRDGAEQHLDKWFSPKIGGNSRTLRIKFKVPDKGIEFKEIKELNEGF